MIKKLQKLIFLLVSILSVNVQAQNLITPITISLPTNPPANTVEWATTMPPVMVTAQTKMQNGQINSAVIESRILVTIKSAGGKVCGTYTAQNAPMSGFNSATKSWSGANVLSLLGQDCILKAGSYELCVQFYGLTPAQAGLIGESCKAFTIKDNRAETYSSPTNISPTKDKILTEKEAKTPLTFRWTPLVPKPRDPVTYRLRVWQLMQGQNGMNAMKANKPVVEKEVKNITQFVKPNLMGDIEMLGSKEAKLVWNVEAISETQAGEKSLGNSEPTVFSVSSPSISAPHTCIIGAKAECIDGQIKVSVNVSWNTVHVSYKLKLFVYDGSTLIFPQPTIPFNNYILSSTPLNAIPGASGSMNYDFYLSGALYSGHTINIESKICIDPDNPGDECCSQRTSFVAPNDCKKCDTCTSVTLSKWPNAIADFGNKTSLSGFITSSGPAIAKIVATLDYITNRKIISTAIAPNPNFEFCFPSSFNSNPAIFPFSLATANARGNIIVSNYSIPVSGVLYRFFIDNRVSKNLYQYKIKLTIFFNDGTYCQKWITEF